MGTLEFVCGGAALSFETLSGEDFDVLHAAVESGSLLRRCHSLAFGTSFGFGPAEPVQPFGQCSPALLRFAAAQLRPPPGGHLLDLGCGRGGPGIWLARHTHTHLTGVDFSRVALSQAARRAAGAGLSADFHLGRLTGTELGDACADAVIAIDSICCADDPTKAIVEIGRLLRPGGRAMITVAQGPAAIRDWEPLVRRACLTVRRVVERRTVTSAWRRLYRLWLKHSTQLRHEVGARLADRLLAEAALPARVLADQRELVLVLAKP